MPAFVLQILPAVLKLVNWLLGYAHDRQMLKAGRLEAINDQLRRINHTVEMARATEIAAEAAHRSDPTDDAFDKDYWRKD